MTDPDLEVTRIRRFGTIVARKRSDGSIQCGCLLEFDGITAWRAHLATAILKALSRISS